MTARRMMQRLATEHHNMRACAQLRTMQAATADASLPHKAATADTGFADLIKLHVLIIDAPPVHWMLLPETILHASNAILSDGIHSCVPASHALPACRQCA